MTTAEFNRRLRSPVYRPRHELKKIADSLGLHGPISAGLLHFHLERMTAANLDAAVFHLSAPSTTATQAGVPATVANVYPVPAGATEMTFEVHQLTPVVSLDSFLPIPDSTMIATFVDRRG